jgi:hypothetical protein
MKRCILSIAALLIFISGIAYATTAKNSTTRLGAQWEKTDEDELSGDFNLIISGTWSGTIKLLKKYKGNDSVATQDGGDGEALLTDSSATFGVDELIGKWLTNDTDAAITLVTDNAATTVTGTLAGGTDNDWDDDDVASLWEEVGSYTSNQAISTAKEPEAGVKYMLVMSAYSSGVAHVRISQ